MPYADLFVWWISSITFNIIFVIIASIYLHRRRKRDPSEETGGRLARWLRDFTFVWILIALLVLYVVSVGQGSYLLFATGNIVVEALMIIYVMRNGKNG